MKETNDRPQDTCIISTDKDLLQIPGHHYNNVRDESRYITERDGYRNFYAQVLSGDVADNVSGLYGIGPKKARRIVDQYSTERGLFQAVRAEWHKHYPGGVDGRSTDEALEECCALLWLSREGRPRWKREDIK